MLYNLSYTMEKKKEKLLSLKKQLKTVNKMMFIVYGAWVVILVSLIYVLVSAPRYFKIIMDTVGIEQENVGKFVGSDLIVLFLIILSSLGIYFFMSYLTSVKLEYDSLRKMIIDQLGASVCNCSLQCGCVDEFVKDMESKGIDLIFY